MGICPHHCPKPSSGGGKVLAVLVLAALTVTGPVSGAAVTALHVVVIAALSAAGLCVLGAAATVAWRVRRRVLLRRELCAAAVPVALPRGTRLAIEAPKLTVIHDGVSAAMQELRRS